MLNEDIWNAYVKKVENKSMQNSWGEMWMCTTEPVTLDHNTERRSSKLILADYNILRVVLERSSYNFLTFLSFIFSLFSFVSLSRTASSRVLSLLSFSLFFSSSLSLFLIDVLSLNFSQSQKLLGFWMLYISCLWWKLFFFESSSFFN